MKKILLTGSTGFIGKNIYPLLRQKYQVTAPSRLELDLRDEEKVYSFVEKGKFDAVVHLANPTGQNKKDTPKELFERSLRVFSSLQHSSNLFGKMIYLGSGAEYGKHRELSQISEEDFGKAIPRDSYGLSRYLMSELSQSHDNFVNLRVFGCYGPGDPDYKLIPHIISCINRGEDILLNQDVFFDFLYVNDLVPVTEHFIENTAEHKAYNACSGKRILISEIAREINRQMGANADIIFKNQGLNREYTGSNLRLMSEIPNWNPRDIKDGISEILEREEQGR